jgi:hypothetical protein
VPRPPRHPLTSAVRHALPRPLERGAEGYLRLLDRRLASLARVAAGDAGGAAAAGPAGLTGAERKLARRFLSPREGDWQDGDENLVRGYLDRWQRGDDRGAAAPARALLECASALAAMSAPPGALWFFLWEMESILAGLAAADNEEGPC